MSNEKAALIVLHGLPRSGKSTWARATGFPIVCPDAVRLAIHGQAFIQSAEPFVWATAHAMTAALFLAGHQAVVLDATNGTRKRRRDWLSPKWRTVFHAIDTPKSMCLERALVEGNLELAAVIERMAASWEPLGPDELRWTD
jgi:predicted kinase